MLLRGFEGKDVTVLTSKQCSFLEIRQLFNPYQKLSNRWIQSKTCVLSVSEDGNF